MTVKSGTRLVVFTSDLSFSVRQGIVDIDDDTPGLQWLVVWHAGDRSVKRLLRSQVWNLRRNGWRWIPYQALDILRRLKPPRAGRTAADAPGREYSASALAARPNVRILRGNLDDSAVIESIRSFEPTLGLSLAAPLLKRHAFGIPPRGTLNLHKGKLPEFRGMPPAFWEVSSGNPSVGCTVHWVDDGLDTGQIVAETAIERAPHSTVKGLQLQLDDLGVRLTRQAAQAALSGSAQSRAQPSHAGKANRKPTLKQFAAMGRRERASQRASAPAWKRIAKETVFASLCTGAALARPVLSPRVTVLLYHRVTDEVRDNLTVGIEQFDRQMAALRRHRDVVSIDEVLGMTKVPRSRRPLVAVTFDDGYLDNFVHAVPILRRHGVPAAFFVSTGIVASVKQFPHDVRRGNAWIPVMDWDQLRSMQRWGFTIGSHTVNHINVAGEPEATARAELATSRDDLKRELGITAPILAYPYGGRQHMTAERLEWVKEAGYRGCLSAYGGVNIGAVDPFNVLRTGIQWEFTDRALLTKTLGLR